MPKARDQFRKYVDDLKNRKWKCKFCGAEFAGSTPRIRAHLAGIPGYGIKACEKVEDPVRAEALETFNGKGSGLDKSTRGTWGKGTERTVFGASQTVLPCDDALNPTDTQNLNRHGCALQQPSCNWLTGTGTASACPQDQVSLPPSDMPLDNLDNIQQSDPSNRRLDAAHGNENALSIQQLLMDSSASSCLDFSELQALLDLPTHLESETEEQNARGLSSSPNDEVHCSSMSVREYLNLDGHTADGITSGIDMDENQVSVIVCYGGEFVIIADHLEYIGGNKGTIYVNVRKPSYTDFERDLKYFLRCKVQKLHYCVLGKELDDCLRCFNDDNGIKDIIYHYLNGNEARVYVEYYSDDNDGEDEDNDEDEQTTTEIGEVRDPTQASNQVGDEFMLDEGQNEREISHINRDEQIGRCPEILGGDVGDEDFIGLEWEVALSSESEDEYLADLCFPSDEDDDELAQSRQKQKEFLRKKFAALEKRPELVNRDEVPAESNRSEDKESCGDEIAGSENELGNDDEPAGGRKSKYPCYDLTVDKPVLSVGMRFDGAKQLKEAIVKNSIVEQRSVEFIRNTKEFVRAKCSQPNCSWKLYGALSRNGSFLIRSFQEEHTCPITFNNKMVTSVWLSKHFSNTIKAMPEIKSSQFQLLVNEQLGVNVSRNQCKRAKLRVMKILMGGYKEEYAQVWDYAGECMLQNPSSRVYVEVVERPLPDLGPSFDKFYVCFDACKRGFLAGCRRVIGLDGCFLKGLCKGKLLVAVGRDANNQMFPIAWAVVKIENKDTWSWFLKNLMADLEITNGGGWAFMSDQQKGLISALAELMPHAEHRMCARHIYANWSRNFKGDKLQKQFWQIAKSTNMVDFRLAKQGLLQLTKEGFDALFQTEAKHWCWAFFSEEFKCDIINNNLSEAFNCRILEAGCKPIISMLDDIRVMVMTRLHRQRDEAMKWTRDCGPSIVKRLDASVAASRFYHPVWNGDDVYEIIQNYDKYVVNLDRRKCSCRAWQLNGIPCAHAVCAIQMKQENPDDYLDDWYKKSSYIASYQFMMQPIRSSKFWEPTNHESPLPLPLKKQIGRSKRRRKMQQEDASSQRMSKTCSYCRKKGHNKKGCELKKRHQEQDVMADLVPGIGPTEELLVGSTEGRTEGPTILPTERQTENLAVRPTKGPKKCPIVGSNVGTWTGTGMIATTTTESTVEQTRKKYPVRRRATAQVAQVAPPFVAAAENDAPQRTRGALGKRLRQYSYGIYTDECTGMTILNLGRTSEVLISQGGSTQESSAQPKKSAPKKKIAGIAAKQPSKKNSVLVPSQPTDDGSNSDHMDQHKTRARTKIAAVKNKENEVIERPVKELAHPVRKSARIMNQFKAPKGKGDGGVVHIN